MTGGTRHEWDSLEKEVQSAIAKTRVNGGNYLACGCGANKFVSFKSRLRCESCGELYQKREQSFAKMELFTKHEQAKKLNAVHICNVCGYTPNRGAVLECDQTYTFMTCPSCGDKNTFNGGFMSGGMEEMAALKKQESGDHYRKMKIQPIEYITANAMPYLDGNVIKYISRHKAKGGADDIRKAIHYLQIILESEYGVHA